MKKEILEEIAEIMYPIKLMYFPTKVIDLNEEPRNIFKAGAKWQQEHGQKVGHSVQVERSYNERDLIKCYCGHTTTCDCEPEQERSYSEEDMIEAFSQGWVTRERFDDLSPEIIYPKGLDYEEKQEYAFNLWFQKFKKK